jgi:hypothetical protein
VRRWASSAYTRRGDEAAGFFEIARAFKNKNPHRMEADIYPPPFL